MMRTVTLILTLILTVILTVILPLILTRDRERELRNPVRRMLYIDRSSLESGRRPDSVPSSGKRRVVFVWGGRFVWADVVLVSAFPLRVCVAPRGVHAVRQDSKLDSFLSQRGRSRHCFTVPLDRTSPVSPTGNGWCAELPLCVRMTV